MEERTVELMESVMEQGQVAEQIVATVEDRELELLRRLEEAEAKIAALEAAAVQAPGRRTIAASASGMVAKEGNAVQASALDAALMGLSIEQRIAVKAELMRAGAIG